MVVGKINPAKLANFSEIDVWTVIACTENTLMDSKEFFRPFITPFELAQALSAYACPHTRCVSVCHYVCVSLCVSMCEVQNVPLSSCAWSCVVNSRRSARRLRRTGSAATP